MIWYTRPSVDKYDIFEDNWKSIEGGGNKYVTWMYTQKHTGRNPVHTIMQRKADDIISCCNFSEIKHSQFPHLWNSEGFPGIPFIMGKLLGWRMMVD